MRDISLHKFFTRVMSARDFIELMESDSRENIANVRILPPRLGREDPFSFGPFGAIEVRFKSPYFALHQKGFTHERERFGR